MRILITGVDGFIGANLRLRLGEAGYRDIVGITRSSTREDLAAGLASADFVFHLAGVNRPKTADEFVAGNRDFTEQLCQALRSAGRRTPAVFSSSTQAALDNPYGRSKRAAEEILLRYGRESGAPVFVFRLTNVFGKWARPDYNSAIATFCHNVARGLPIRVDDPAARLGLVYIDDVVDAFIRCLTSPGPVAGQIEAGPVYETTVGEVADIIRSFLAIRSTLMSPPVGVGLARALYATYVSHLPVTAFAYQVPQYVDPRGAFAEVLKTPDCGQFSYFTAHPGVTRGEHYHHSKSEKFVVIRGTAKFRFRQIETGEFHEIVVRGGEGYVVETIPGWAHDITNTGGDELIVMLWANEIFDRARPDTIAKKVVE
ncbi:capsular polysaccharide biosynthesis protein CapF [Bradyrhizobium sp. KBS0727]|uniref:UDP-2-acetamido-2,6-beta-L-arabino-hexul-4-ose reductase n=1 Tax=unclassified Bradyrhizobium TaxID=2631580 RepID=UPI00110D4FFC|nr:MULTISPECIES: capsular polysaccharide biosynthesis protein CapF [unclassified Bradyrhizobium]QDW39786.1 capsular polysaccharide biosynthesis protein CapF [Bradyrhizobium sp. KBS0725]QDW46389.1 capsular polysaccharide biosynthesis protein CapF [Bradyrhizobium sp. KBS0727]